jgi:hypothetical protein
MSDQQRSRHHIHFEFDWTPGEQPIIHDGTFVGAGVIDAVVSDHPTIPGVLVNTITLGMTADGTVYPLGGLPMGVSYIGPEARPAFKGLVLLLQPDGDTNDANSDQ